MAEHLPDCYGNGEVACWSCGGSGHIWIPDDDMTEMCVECDTCGGTGCIECAACREDGL